MKVSTKKIVATALVFALTVGSVTAVDQDVLAAKKPKLSATKISLKKGGTKTVTIKNAKGKKVKSLKWTTSNKKVATVKKSSAVKAKVKAMKKGSAVVTAKFKYSGKKYALKTKVTVTEATAPKETAETESSTPAVTASAEPVVTEKPTAAPWPTKPPTPTPKPTATPKPAPTANPNFKEVSLAKASFDNGLDNFYGRGSAKLVSDASGQTGKCVKVNGRSASWNGPAIDVTEKAVTGAVYKFSAYVKQNSGSDQNMKMSFEMTTKAGGTTWPGIGSVTVKSGQWTKMDFIAQLPAKLFTKVSVYFESESGDFDFFIDEFSMTQVSEGCDPFDPMTLTSLKDAFADSIPNMGTCITAGSFFNQLADEELMKYVSKHYNSITLENELKPERIMTSELISVDDGKKLGYIFPTNYEETKVPKINFNDVDKALEYCHKYNMRMRAHTLIWHQQMNTIIYKKNYDPNTEAVVEPNVMNARLEWFIRTVIRHVLEKEKQLTGSYGSIVYTWDVLNEYPHRQSGPQSPYFETVYGNMKTEPVWVREAFGYAYEELQKSNVEDKVSLVVNDYNTYETRDELIKLIKYINSGRLGKICAGVGMQSHLDCDYPTIEKYAETLDKFKAAGLEIQITELDVTRNYPKGTASPQLKRTEEYQANYYADLFKVILERKKAGANITGITFWGIHDGRSWRSEYKPLLFGSGFDDPKEAFYRVIEMAGLYKSM